MKMTSVSEEALISDEQKAQFSEVGYCAVADLYTPVELDEIEAFFEEYKTSGAKVFDGNNRYEEVDPKQQQVRAMQTHRYSNRVKEWLLNPRVASVLETLLGKPALAAQSMYYYKPPGATGQGMHQDNFYLLAKPATCIAAWTPIDSADVDNGCLWLVPGSHRGDIICPQDNTTRWMNYGKSHISHFPRDQKPVPVPVRRGETLFFGGNLIHGSGPNRTLDRSRRTFIGHYIDEASDQVARFYHPVLNRQGEVVSDIAIPEGGGPCGDGWMGAVH